MRWSEWQDLNLRPPRPEEGACGSLRPVRVESFAEIDWDDSILFAMKDQNRSPDLGRAQVRAKLILQKEPHWHKPIVPRPGHRLLR